jgi:uroporphyrin-III C-methyltransferase
VGTVVFIGAGPGSADLITVRGAKRLAQAEVVLYDALTDPALQELAPQAQWVHVGKRGCTATDGAQAYDSTAQSKINALLVQYGLKHQCVVRLKGGDASIFGRLEEELEAVAEAGIAAEVVPGVTAAIAAAAGTLRPLTRRGTGRSLAFTTAMTQTGEMHVARSADTEVFYMAGRQLPALARRLLQAGWPCDTPVSVVSRAGWPDQRHSEHTVTTLLQARELHAGRPTVVTVGAGAARLRATPPTPP